MQKSLASHMGELEQLSATIQARGDELRIAYSQAQKDLIDDLMDEFRREHPELEPFFSESLEEPLFVKNLENVQGDERDVIIFSIGYAPDKDKTIHFFMTISNLNLFYYFLF